MRPEREKLGEKTGYVVEVTPTIKWGRVLFVVKILTREFGILEYKIEEIPEWLDYGCAVVASVARKTVEGSFKLVVEELTRASDAEPARPEPIKVLAFDKGPCAGLPVLEVERPGGRRLSIPLLDEQVADNVPSSLPAHCYALFIERPDGTKLIGLVDAKKYEMFRRVRWLANSIGQKSSSLD